MCYITVYPEIFQTSSWVLLQPQHSRFACKQILNVEARSPRHLAVVFLLMRFEAVSVLGYTFSGLAKTPVARMLANAFNSSPKMTNCGDTLSTN